MGDWIDGVGEGDREEGSGTWEGVDGNGARFSSTAIPVLAFLKARFEAGLYSLDLPLDAGFFNSGDGGAQSSSGAGVSFMFGSPLWGPLRLRIEEKCSQS